MNDAAQEKLRLITWLLPQLRDGEVLAAEFAFRDVSRKADLAVIGPQTLAAIEVKGPRDNLDTITAQVDDYMKAFLTVDVAVASCFLAAARERLPRAVGIIELAADRIIRRRNPRARDTLTPEQAVQWLRAVDLRRHLGAEARHYGIEEARAKIAKKLSRRTLSELAISVARERARERYQLFLNEKGSRLSLDDVATLQLPTRIR